MEEIILLTDGTLDGVFTAIYDGFVIRNKSYKEKLLEYRDNIKICMDDNYEMSMFATYVEVKTNVEKSYKTAISIRKKLGEYIYTEVIRALCHNDKDRATMVFGFLVRGFAMGRNVVQMLGDDYVMRVMELSRKASREAHLYRGFVRFKDIEGTLYSVIEPKCNVLWLIGEHFSERYPNENWIIYDKKRKIAAIHKKYNIWVMSEGELDGDYLTEIYENEDEMGKLWKTFCDAHFIRERKNEKCQNNLIPKWYREHMVEFQAK